MKLMILLIYGFTFSVVFFVVALLWHWQMSGVYFASPDRGFITDFVPPFVHVGATGNYFMKPRRAVYAIWAVYAGITVIVPAVCAWLFARYYQHELKKAWM